MISILGVWAAVIPGVAAGGAAVALAVCVLQAAGFRPPAFASFLGPAAVVLTGSLGTIVALRTVAGALHVVDPWQRQTLAQAGVGEALEPLAFGLLVAGALCALTAPGVGLGAAIGAGREAKSSFALPALAVLGGGFLGVTTPLFFLLGGDPVGLGALGALAFFALFGVGLAGLRLPEDEEQAPRVAAARPLAWALATAAVLCGAFGLALHDHAGGTRYLALADPAQQAVLTAYAQRAVQVDLGAGLFGAVVVSLVGLPPVFAVGPMLPDVRGGVGFVGSALAAFVALIGAAVAAWWAQGTLQPDLIADRVRTIQLPHAKGPTDSLTGECLVVEKGNDLAVESISGQCSATALPAPHPLLAVHADTPASRLRKVSWGPVGTRIAVLTRSAEGHLGVVWLDWQPEPQGPELAVVDEVTGDHVYHLDSQVGLPGEPDAWKGEFARLRTQLPAVPVVLYPGAQWNLQDLLARCALVEGPCVVGGGQPAIPVAPEPEPERAVVRRVAAATPETDEAPSGQAATLIKRTVQRNSGQLKYCYESELRNNPDLEGRVAFDITVVSGRVAQAVVTSNSTGDRQLADCMRLKIERWTFDPGVPDGTFSYPFVFKKALTP